VNEQNNLLPSAATKTSTSEESSDSERVKSNLLLPPEYVDI